MKALKYLSDKVLGELREAIVDNLSLYKGAGFSDFADKASWNISLQKEFDEDLLRTLDKSQPQFISAIDLENSKIVGKALSGLSPSLANEERIWVRLAHVEAFEYSQARWIKPASDDETLLRDVRNHFFAPGQTGIRDDHSISRLWWNYHIAGTCMPEDIDVALNLILKSADIRSNFVERIWMTSRQSIASSVLKIMREDPWVTGAEQNFRYFMKVLNRQGGGIVFEALASQEIDDFVKECAERAKKMAG